MRGGAIPRDCEEVGYGEGCLGCRGPGKQNGDQGRISSRGVLAVRHADCLPLHVNVTQRLVLPTPTPAPAGP